ncbi:MAG TPA: hypothetical protein VM123_03465 [archaeon]|nr:hypothetical protein [archaeon]
MPSDLDIRIDAFEKAFNDYTSGIAPFSAITPYISGFGGLNEPTLAELYVGQPAAKDRMINKLLNKVFDQKEVTKEDWYLVDSLDGINGVTKLKRFAEQQGLSFTDPGYPLDPKVFSLKNIQTNIPSPKDTGSLLSDGSNTTQSLLRDKTNLNIVPNPTQPLLRTVDRGRATPYTPPANPDIVPNVNAPRLRTTPTDNTPLSVSPTPNVPNPEGGLLSQAASGVGSLLGGDKWYNKLAQNLLKAGGAGIVGYLLTHKDEEKRQEISDKLREQLEKEADVNAKLNEQNLQYREALLPTALSANTLLQQKLLEAKNRQPVTAYNNINPFGPSYRGPLLARTGGAGLLGYGSLLGTSTTQPLLRNAGTSRARTYIAPLNPFIVPNTNISRYR